MTGELNMVLYSIFVLFQTSGAQSIMGNERGEGWGGVGVLSCSISPVNSVNQSSTSAIKFDSRTVGERERKEEEQ